MKIQHFCGKGDIFENFTLFVTWGGKGRLPTGPLAGWPAGQLGWLAGSPKGVPAKRQPIRTPRQPI